MAAATLEQLEDRTLLAGNVTAQFLGQHAFVNGDSADNSVQVLVDGGNIVLRGSDGTTINGSSNDFVLAANSTSLPGSLVASLSSGNDTFAVDGITIGRDLFVNGGSGNDLLVASATNVGRNLTVWGAAGNDDIVVDASRIERDVNLAGFGGDDDIVIRDSTVVDDLRIIGHGGQDIIHLDSVLVGDKSLLAGGGGADNIQIQGTSQFADRMRAFGGAGSDNIEATAGVIFDGLKRRSFSGFVANTATIAARITDTTTGAIAAAEAAVGSAVAADTLSLSVDNTSFSEGAGNTAATLTVTRTAADITSDLVVSLAATPTGQTKLTLAESTVTIPAGQTSATVTVNAVDDTVIDGDTVVTVTATATGLDAAAVTITVTDDDAHTLTVSAASSTFNEDTGSATTTGSATLIDVTVSRDGDTTNELVVTLASSADTRLTVPNTVTIPAGQAQQTFTASTVPNTQVEGADTVVTIDATAAGSTAGQLDLTLVDNDAATLSAEFSAPDISEDGTLASGQAQLTVIRNTPTTSDLVVTLSTDNTTRFLLSATTLTIPAGSDRASITVSGIDNTDLDGAITVGVTATATDFANANATIVVQDNDSALGLTITSGSTVQETAGTAAISATISRSSASLTGDLVVGLTTTGDDRVVLPAATVTIPDGQTSVNFTVNVVDNQLVDASGLVASITASATGFVSSSQTVTVIEDDIATIALTPASSTIAEDAGASATTLRVERNSITTAETIALIYSDSLITGPTTVSFAVDQTFAIITLAVTDNDSFADNADVIITAQAPGRSDVTTTISVTNDDILTLTTDTTTNAAVSTILASVTRDNTFTVTGFTEPGATVQIESDGDGLFDEQSTVAATDGGYSFDVPLTHTDVNNGLNVFQVRSVLAADGVQETSGQILVHLAVGTVVRFGINQDLDQDGTNEFFDVELLDTDAPNTVANFLLYANDDSYDNLLAHRSPLGFVVQGGSFTVDNSVVSPVVTRAAIDGEFNEDNSNIDGTLSMALTGAGPDSGTSGWFFNLTDNSTALDADEHTVFGRVIAGGIDVLRFINQNIDTIDLSLVTGQPGLLDTTPLVRSPLTTLSGTSTITNDSNVVVGTGTLFTTELQVGSVIVDPLGGQLIVTAITSDTELTVDLEADRDENGVPFTLLNLPADDDYVIFSSIGEILDQI